MLSSRRSGRCDLKWPFFAFVDVCLSKSCAVPVCVLSLTDGTCGVLVVLTLCVLLSSPQVFSGVMVAMWGVATFITDVIVAKALAVFLIALLGVPFAATNM